MLPIVLKIGKVMSKNSSVILTGVGVVGTIATAVLTYKATCKTLDDIVDMKVEAEKDLPANEEVELDKTDIFKRCWKHWIPVVLTVTCTAISIITANRISAAKLATLASAYKLSEDTRKNYKNAIVDKFGPNKAKDVDELALQNKLKEREAKGIDYSGVISTGDGDTLIYDAFNDRFFRSSQGAVELGLARFSSSLTKQAFGEASMEDLYSSINLSAGDVCKRLYWVVGGDNNDPRTKNIEPKWSSMKLKDGNTCLVLGLEIDDNLPKMQIA